MKHCQTQRFWYVGISIFFILIGGAATGTLSLTDAIFLKWMMSVAAVPLSVLAAYHCLRESLMYQREIVAMKKECHEVLGFIERLDGAPVLFSHERETLSSHTLFCHPCRRQYQICATAVQVREAGIPRLNRFYELMQ